jgi:hypothetical protein
MAVKRLESLADILAMYEDRYHGAIEYLAYGAWYLVVYEDIDPQSPMFGDRIVVRVGPEGNFTGLEDALSSNLYERTGNPQYPISVKCPTAYLVIEE